MHCATDRTIHHKQGLSYQITGSFEDEQGNPIPLNDITLTSKIRDNRNTVFDCTIQKSTDGLEYTATVADTSNWPIGMLYTDIIIEQSDGTRSATETLIIINSYSPSKG